MWKNKLWMDAEQVAYQTAPFFVFVMKELKTIF